MDELSVYNDQNLMKTSNLTINVYGIESSQRVQIIYYNSTEIYMSGPQQTIY
jgi:hypothetical protein